MIKELWKPIKGYEDIYEVSELGKVRNKLYANNYTLFGGFNTKQGLILKHEIDIAGYTSIRLTKDKESKTYRIHRLVAQAFISNPENKPYVNHIDGNKLNNKTYNLEWVTAKENTQHAITTGLITYQKKPVYCKETDTTYESKCACSTQLKIQRTLLSNLCTKEFTKINNYNLIEVGESID